MRKLLNALAGGALVIMLSAPAAHAASPAMQARQQQSGIERHHRDDDGDWRDDRDDDGDRDHYRDDDHWRRCHHGIVGALIHWLI